MSDFYKVWADACDDYWKLHHADGTSEEADRFAVGKVIESVAKWLDGHEVYSTAGMYYAKQLREQQSGDGE